MIKTLAIVDDELELEEIFSLIFEDLISQGLLRVAFFSEAQTLWDWLETSTPDLVITDIGLNGIYGTELVARLRMKAPSIPVYFMSAHGEDRYHAVMRELGVSRYVTKPFNAEDLLGLVEQDLQLRPMDSQELAPRFP